MFLRTISYVVIFAQLPSGFSRGAPYSDGNETTAYRWYWCGEWCLTIDQSQRLAYTSILIARDWYIGYSCIDTPILTVNLCA